MASSGGESAAIAAGMSPIGIGSDVAISLRGPAAFTGITALKATHGRIPFTGHLAPMTSAWFHVGPMARTVRDVALGYSLLSGPDGIDGYAVHAKDIDSASTRIAGQTIRVGWVSDDAFGPVDPEITAAVADAAARLADLGCHVERIDAPFLRETDALTADMTFFYSNSSATSKPWRPDARTNCTRRATGIVAMEDPTFAQLHAARTTREALRSAFAGYFRDYDVLLCPVTPMTAPPHGPQEARHRRCHRAVAPRDGHYVVLQSDWLACAFGAIWLQLREPADRYSARVEVVRRVDHPATRCVARTQGRSGRSPSANFGLGVRDAEPAPPPSIGALKTSNCVGN